MRQYTKAFQENLSVICDELLLAKQWGKASIILTIHKSTFSQEKTKKALRKKLGVLGYRIVPLEINKVNGNFIEYMLQHENIENIVFYISNVRWGGGEDEKDGYRVLNLYRETFIEHRVKAVFFLTLHEASRLPDYAPDFWAFRHRVLGFGSPHARDQKRPPVGLLLWHLESSKPPYIDIKSKIAMLTEMLAEIPVQAEALSLRIDLQYELGFLYWHLGDRNSAEKALTSGIGLAKTYEFIDPLAKLQNGLAIIGYEQDNYQGALALLEPIIEANPRDCYLLLNQAIVMFAMKKRYNAIAKGKKAASICAQNSWVWNSLGFLYYFAGIMDEAATCFQRAIDISPKVGYFYESLAACYLASGLQDKANAQLHQAQNYAGARGIFQVVLKEYIEDNAENVPLLIKEAMQAGQLTQSDVLRDPTLNAVLDLSDS